MNNPAHGLPKTLPMTVSADASLSLTLQWLASRLTPDDSRSVQKLMTLYGDLRVAEALSAKET